jgi:hypothetical protein
MASPIKYIQTLKHVKNICTSILSYLSH